MRNSHITDGGDLNLMVTLSKRVGWTQDWCDEDQEMEPLSIRIHARGLRFLLVANCYQKPLFPKIPGKPKTFLPG